MIKRKCSLLLLLLYTTILIAACKRERIYEQSSYEDPISERKINEDVTIIGIPVKGESIKDTISTGQVLVDTTLPKDTPSQILNRIGYTTSYNHKTKCPNWVAWHLTSEHVDGPFTRKGMPYYDVDGSVIGIGHVTPKTQRGDYFIDLQAEEPRQEFSDWTDTTVPNNSHGHICPAADCRWSKTSMNQSFLLTNICPQDKDLNGGDWEGLERRCRGWAKHYGEIFIVAGPVFYNGVKTTMGANKVGVPDAFFKVVLCLEREPKAIGFIFPNNAIHHELEEYVKSVDEVEDVLGFDFFHNLPDDIEMKIESTSNLKQW